MVREGMNLPGIQAKMAAVPIYDPRHENTCFMHIGNLMLILASNSYSMHCFSK